MTKPTLEQMAAFEQYMTQHTGEPISDDVRRKVLNDEAEESNQRDKRRRQWDRRYNASYIPPVKDREIAEEDE